MSWEPFLAGLIVGWLVEFAVDYFFWRPRRVCPEAEEELREATVILKQELSRLRRQQPQDDGGQEEAKDDQEEDEEEQEDDLQRIWGIGPKVEALLFTGGITTFSQLAATDAHTLEKKLQSGGDRYRLTRYNVIESWQQQAALAAAGRWPELDALQTEVARSRRQRNAIRPR